MIETHNPHKRDGENEPDERLPVVNHWNESFRNKLLAIPVGESRVFFYIGCGGRKGTATRVDENHVRWLIPGTGESNAVLLTIDECVERFGYH